MEVVLIVLAVLAVLAIVGYFVNRAATPKSVRQVIPTLPELEAERDRLVAEREAAEARDDKEAVTELTLQIRTKEHWINKARTSDEGWREYYEKTSGKLLDEWGKTGSK